MGSLSASSPNAQTHGYTLLVPGLGPRRVTGGTGPDAVVTALPEVADDEVDVAERLGGLRRAYDAGWLARPVWAGGRAPVGDAGQREAWLTGSADRHGHGFVRARPRRGGVVGVRSDGGPLFGAATPVDVEVEATTAQARRR